MCLHTGNNKTTKRKPTKATSLLHRWTSILAKILNPNVVDRDGFNMPTGYTPNRYNICGYINNRVY